MLQRICLCTGLTAIFCQPIVGLKTCSNPFSVVHILMSNERDINGAASCKKVMVSYSLIAVGVVGVRGLLYLGHTICKAKPISLLSLLLHVLISDGAST